MNKIQMASKLYDARDTLKILFPDKYNERVASIQLSIKDVMLISGKNELESAIDLAASQDNAVIQMWIFAAAIEMMEDKCEK